MKENAIAQKENPDRVVKSRYGILRREEQQAELECLEGTPLN